MAHRVKCSICSQIFDRDKEPFVNTSARRYAHYKCATGIDPPKNQEEQDKEKLEQYIKKLFNIDYITPKIQKQIKSYRKDYNYTYSGIHGALVYAFEIKHNKIEKANGGIGLVPYIYEQARLYYQSLLEVQEQNEEKIKNAYKPKEVVVYIKPPERKVKKRKLFSFLDEEEVNEQ